MLNMDQTQYNYHYIYGIICEECDAMLLVQFL